MTTINWSFNIQVAGGPQIALSKSKSVEAYDKIEVVIDPVGKGGAEKVVDIQPGGAAQVNFLLIKSNLYTELTYTVSDGTKNSSPIALDEPQVYLGVGAISLLNVAPKSIKFKNENTTDSNKKAEIEILVGRDATP